MFGMTEDVLNYRREAKQEERSIIMTRLVAYFSAGGTTAKVAEKLAEASGAKLYRIEPAVPYTKADLNWMNKKSRSSVEMADKSSRPELADKDAPVAESDVIFLGFPIWWYTSPTIVCTFLESYDFAGKTVVPFATSGGSGMGDTAADLQAVVPEAKVLAGRLFKSRVSQDELTAWVQSLGL